LCTIGPLQGIVFYSSYGTIYAATLSVSPFDGEVLVNNNRNKQGGLAPPVEIDVGDYPSSSILRVSDQQIFVFEAHGNGFCQNNEIQNKQPYPASCRQQATPTANVLVYNYGLLSSW